MAEYDGQEGCLARLADLDTIQAQTSAIYRSTSGNLALMPRIAEEAQPSLPGPSMGVPSVYSLDLNGAIAVHPDASVGGVPGPSSFYTPPYHDSIVFSTPTSCSPSEGLFSSSAAHVGTCTPPYRQPGMPAPGRLKCLGELFSLTPRQRRRGHHKRQQKRRQQTPQGSRRVWARFRQRPSPGLAPLSHPSSKWLAVPSPTLQCAPGVCSSAGSDCSVELASDRPPTRGKSSAWSPDWPTLTYMQPAKPAQPGPWRLGEDYSRGAHTDAYTLAIAQQVMRDLERGAGPEAWRTPSEVEEEAKLSEKEKDNAVAVRPRLWMRKGRRDWRLVLMFVAGTVLVCALAGVGVAVAMILRRSA